MGANLVAYINRNDVVLSGEDCIIVEDTLERRIAPVKYQAAAVDRPCEQRLMCKSHTELLDGRASNVANVKFHVWNQAFQPLVNASGRSIDGTHTSWIAGADGVIPNDTCGVFRVVVCNARAGIHPMGSQPVVTRWSICLDNDIVPLSSIDNNTVGVVWLDRDKVVGNHFELMAVNTELELAVGGDVDQADQVLLARLENRLGFLAPTNATLIPNCRAVECVGSIDKEIAERLGNAIFLFVTPGAEGRYVRPVLKKQRIEVLVIISCRRTVEYQCSEQSF